MKPDDTIPQTDSIEELARFWDTHDLTDYEDELEEVAEPVFEQEMVVPVHLRAEEFRLVNELAARQGLSHAELMRQWVREKTGCS